MYKLLEPNAFWLDDGLTEAAKRRPRQQHRTATIGTVGPLRVVAVLTIAGHNQNKIIKIQLIS